MPAPSTAPSPNAGIRIAIAARPLVEAEISPLQYGQFIEYLADVVPGMWAEKLSDTSFEGIGQWDWHFIAATDGVDRPWYPAGQVNRAAFDLDPEQAVSGKVSQRVRTNGETPCTVGIGQDGLALAAGEELELSIWVRGKSRDDAVHVELLDRDGTIARASVPLTPTWTKRMARLTPKAGAANGTIRISIKGPGEVWLDNASLMPRDHLQGWRRDVVEAIKELHPAIIRYGGCAVDNTKDPKHFAWDWIDSVGDPDRRKPFWAWGGIQHTGPGLEEIVQLIRMVGAEPLLTVRVSKRTPQDAAAMVEYFNGAAATPMGAKRAANGRREPWGVRYWQVGNELGGDEYERLLPEFCGAMRAVDPSIVLLASFASDRTIAASGGTIDYLCPHHYAIADLAGVNADLDAQARRCATATRRTRVGVTEWNVTAQDPGLQRGKIWTLQGALHCARYRNLLHRRCDLVEISNRSNIANSICTGAIQTDRDRLFRTAPYHVEALYATLAGNIPLAIADGAHAGLDLSATYRGGASPTVTLFAVNPGLEPISGAVDLGGFARLDQRGEQRIERWLLADREQAGEPDAFNDFRDPERISPVRSELTCAGTSLAHTFPALSLTVLRFQVAAMTR